MNVVQSKQSYLHIPIEQKWVVDFEGSQKTREYLILTLIDLRFNIAVLRSAPGQDCRQLKVVA